jgi:hypothetical protein
VAQESHSTRSTTGAHWPSPAGVAGRYTAPATGVLGSHVDRLKYTTAGVTTSPKVYAVETEPSDMATAGAPVVAGPHPDPGLLSERSVVQPASRYGPKLVRWATRHGTHRSPTANRTGREGTSACASMKPSND